MTDEIKKEAGAERGKGTAGEVKPPEAAGGEASKKEGAQKNAPAPKKEKPDKCEQCGKALSRVKWYYRNGGYYCTKRCWKEFGIKQEGEKKKAEAAAPAQA
ncbi:MAG: hypothetical protein NTX71_12250 [Candidatus Aureabacteria bacterium]|nr:hypothetical protein [Candidatus Auribacterota bacterium]